MSGTLALKADARQKVMARLAINRVQPVVLTAQESSENARRKRRESVKQFRARLAIECPHAFSAFDHAPRTALAIGIRQQLALRYPDVPNRTRRLLLKGYTTSAAYLRLLILGALRAGLDGSVAGHVTEAEAQDAAERLQQLQTLAAARQKNGGSDG